MKKLNFTAFIVATLICIAVIGLHIYSSKERNEIHLNQIEEIIIESKKQLLKDTVNNIYLEIDSLAQAEYLNPEDDIDQLVKDRLEEIVRKRKFSDNSKVWISEIIDYEGGDNFAIKKVDPNSPETEGMYLSTAIEDIHGNTPYLIALEEIKKNGDVFYIDYFNGMNGQGRSEKLVYTKLFEEYDLVVSMGVDLNDIDMYAEQVKQEIGSLFSQTIIQAVMIFLLVLLVGFSLLYILTKTYLSTATDTLTQQIDTDLLTNTYSRNFGEKALKASYKEYMITNESPVIMMLDIDDFKQINDTYGHDVGDYALKEITRSIELIIRQSDRLIRWGGDEFVGIFKGTYKENIMELANKIKEVVSAIKIPIEDGTIGVSVSIGFSYFKTSDMSYSGALKRADKAMYKDKEKNKIVS